MGSKCIKIQEDKKTFTHAESECKIQGGTLVTSDSERETAYTTQTLLSSSSPVAGI